jgi:hypothetical protein
MCGTKNRISLRKINIFYGKAEKMGCLCKHKNKLLIRTLVIVVVVFSLITSVNMPIFARTRAYGDALHQLGRFGWVLEAGRFEL